MLPLTINYLLKLERPEESFDSRSLYERLQEQKQKKDLEYEEAHKLSMLNILYFSSTYNYKYINSLISREHD